MGDGGRDWYKNQDGKVREGIRVPDRTMLEFSNRKAEETAGDGDLPNRRKTRDNRSKGSVTSLNIGSLIQVLSEKNPKCFLSGGETT